MDGNRASLETVARDHTQTQNNLRQATAALDSAFRRIRQLRHSILELADALPSTESTNRNRNPSNIGPAHEAIVLSDSTSDIQVDSVVADMDRLRSTLPPSVMESLERFEAEGRAELFQGRVPQPPIGTPSRQSTLSHNVHSTSSPRSHDSLAITPSHDPFLPRRPFLETQLSRRRSLNMDDVSTTIGRRVAAREARGGQNSAGDPAPRLEQILLNTTALIARNIDNINNRVAAQRILRLEQPTSPRTDMAPEYRRLSEDGYSGRGSQSSGTNTSHLGPASNNVPPSRQVQSRRWRGVRAEAVGRQSSGALSTSGPPETSAGTSARLSALSSFSTFDNLGSPLTPHSRERPILFDEPYSYVQPSLPLRRSSEDFGTTDNRSYLIRRMLDADGEELVHNINLGLWDEDDPSAWLMPERQRTLDPSLPTPRRFRGNVHLQRSDSPVSQPPPQIPRRRRGWARLDPDGNEIPTDEEEELERTRSQFRVRSLHNARATSSHNQPDVATLMPVTRTSMLHEPSEEENVARVRINAQDSTRYMTSVVGRSRRPGGGHQPTHSTAETVVPHSPHVFGTSLPFLVDPLPMPLDDMITSKYQPSNTDRGKGVMVSNQSMWAGR